MVAGRSSALQRPRLLVMSLALIVASTVLVGCQAAPEPEAEFVGMLAVDPESSFGLPKPLGLEPILQDETHLMDEAETSLITSVVIENPDSCAAGDPDRSPCEFVIGFSAIPREVVVGSVLVAGVSPQTPAGLLVTVTSIDGLTVGATEAGLGDALEQGDGSVEKQFTVDDVAHVELAPGVTPVGHAAAYTTGPQSVQEPGDKEFNYGVNHVEIADGVFADGLVSFDMGCGAYAGVSWETVLGVPVYPNGVYFEAKCGASQAGSINVTATKTATVNDSAQIASFDLDPITIWAIVPIVFVPHVAVSVSAKGDVTADMTFGASESFSATAGINYSDGFHAIKDFGYDFSGPSATGSWRLSAEASVTVSESLLLYDIAGPAMSETLYVKLEGNSTGTPLWCIRGGVRAEASLILETKVKDLVWGPEQLIDLDKELGCAENSAPTISISTPGSGVYYPHDGAFPPTFSAIAQDPEEGFIPAVWTSSKDGELGTGTLVNPPLSFGTHVITATITDSQGLSASQSITIDVTELKPDVSFQAKDANGVWQPMTSMSGVQGDFLYFRLVTKHAASLMNENCADVSWASSLPVAAVGQCDYSLNLTKQGTFTVKSTVTDENGASGTASFSVSVAAPPTVIVPNMSAINATLTPPTPAIGISEGAEIEGGSTVTLHVSYLNEPSAKVTVRYEWWVKNTKTGAMTLILGSDNIPSTGSYRDWIAPSGGGTYLIYAYMFNKSTGVKVDTSTYNISVKTPIK